MTSLDLVLALTTTVVVERRSLRLLENSVVLAGMGEWRGLLLVRMKSGERELNERAIFGGGGGQLGGVLVSMRIVGMKL